jgi:16S rRNA (cytosine967-C5)-methyltransferase
VLRRVFEHGAYADRALAAEGADLAPRERALARALAYGAVQRAATLDHLAGLLVDRPLSQLQPAVLAAIRLGLFQLLYMRGIASHAAVNETVELIKPESPGGATLVNAVLRRAAAEGKPWLEELDDRTPASASLLHSAPLWLVERWWQELGQDVARALLAHINTPPESALRVNTLVTSTEQAMEQLPVAARPAPDLPEGLILEEPFDAHGSGLWQRGAIMPQARASMVVSRVLEPQPGERVLDLCAAPGAKSTHLAALIRNTGGVTAVERHPGRAEALRRTCARMQASCVRVEVGDAAVPRHGEQFERVLIDPPCTGLGTLQSRPDLRWRASPDSIAELAELQSRILAAGATVTAPGGVLVYSVCTICRSEAEGVIGPFLSSHDEFELDDLGARLPQWSQLGDGRCLQLLPHRDQTDGFFIARLRRR